MSLNQVSDHHFARSEHSIRLDEIESSSYELFLASESSSRAMLDDVDDCSTSAASFHVFLDEWNDTTLCADRLVKSLAKPMPNQVHFYSSPRKQAYGQQEKQPSDKLHKSRLIASMLYESLTEMLSSSHGDKGISALDNVARNIGSLARLDSREAQKEKLANLLTEGMNAYESRSTVPISGPINRIKQTLCLAQKDQLVDVLSEVFSKIEELIAAEGGTPRDEPETAETVSLAATFGSDDMKTASSRRSNKRRSSFHSEASSIISRASASRHPDSPIFDGCSVYRLPVELTARPKSVPAPAIHRASTPKFSTEKLEGRSGIQVALQDSFSSFSSTDTEDAAPKRPQRRGSFRGNIMQDSFSSFCSFASDDKTPKRPQRNGFNGDYSLDDADTDHATATGQPSPGGSRLDDFVSFSREAARRPRSRRPDVQAALPLRLRSFDATTS